MVRILSYQIIIGIVPLLLLGFGSILTANNVLKNEAISFQKQNVRQGTLYIDLVMNDVESLIANLSGINEVNEALSRDTTGTSYEKLTTQAKIGYILSGYTSLKGLVSIDLFSSKGEHYHVGETLNANNINNTILQKLFTEAKNSQAFVNWNGIENNINLDSEFSNVITATKILYANRTDPDNFTGLLVVSYDPFVFSEMFSNQSDPSSYSIVTDSKNRIVFHPDKKYLGQTLSDNLSEQISASENGSFLLTIDDVNMLVVYGNTLKGGWTVAKFIPLVKIQSYSNEITRVFLILILLSLIVIVIFGHSMSRQIIKPIKQVTDTFRLLQTGDFNNVSKINIIHQDELGELGNLFNSFIDAREDITTQKKLERQLNSQNQELHDALETLKVTQTQMVQQEKMAGIGQLAAGVAHEINNPLGFVKANFSVLNKYLDRVESLLDTVNIVRNSYELPSEEKTKLVNNIWAEKSIDYTRSDLKEIISDTQEGLDRIAEIVNALKTFSRSSLLDERSPYDLNEGIKTTLLIANNEIKYNCSVVFEPSILPEISVNGGQINQVLLNIIVNAAQAIKQKEHAENGIIKIQTYVENDYVCCDIKDNGIGMTDEVAKRIFEPFYTTKAVGQGTGLGLSLAYDIVVNKHNGKLEVMSELGRGTLFKIIIPISQKKIKDE